MEKIYIDLMTATDEHEQLNTTHDERCAAYDRISKRINIIKDALNLCEIARERGDGTPVLERVESLLYAALNG